MTAGVINVISLRVNEIDYVIDVPPDTPLLTILRDTLKLKGSRFGCGQERCGACTVLVDNLPQHSCRLPVSAVIDRPVTTIEGLGTASEPGPLQKLFIEEQAAQCGYCINGVIVALSGLLRRQPLPTRSEVLHHLDERHLCRCGAHVRILRVVDRALAGEGGPART